MSELAEGIKGYLSELRLQNASRHTLRNYASDLAQFLEYFSPPRAEPPAPERIDAILLREWLASLYHSGLDPLSIRRKLAAVRSFFQFMVRERAVAVNPARVLRTPKAPKLLWTNSSGRIRSATWRCSSCYTAAGCASAS